MLQYRTRWPLLGCWRTVQRLGGVLLPGYTSGSRPLRPRPLVVMLPVHPVRPQPPLCPAPHYAGGAQFAVGQSVQRLDAVVYCTGFEYCFPFLDLEVLGLSTAQQHVEPLYQHLFSPGALRTASTSIGASFHLAGRTPWRPLQWIEKCFALHIHPSPSAAWCATHLETSS